MNNHVERRLNDGIYNSRLINNYVEYIERFHKDIDIDSLLQYAEITRYEVEDPAHWFTQNQIDRFHEILVKETKKPDLAREVGRFAALSKASGTVRQYTLGFVSPASAYWLMEKIAAKLSRATTVKTKRLARNQVEISVIPNPGVQDKPYQCENRKGLFEALARLFTNKFADIDHPVCVHEGGIQCNYIITWEITSALIWKSLFNYSMLTGLVLCVVLYFFLPLTLWTIVILLTAMIVIGILCRSENCKSKDLRRTLEKQGSAAQELLEVMNIRYNNAMLAQEIGQAVSTILDIHELVGTVIKVMERRLDFDRGMIMLANKEGSRLVYAAGYGYDKEKETLLKDAELHLNKSESKGLFVLTFNNQRPFLVNDIKDMEKQFSARSQELVRRMGVSSIICVPIAYESRSLGILAVDNIESKRVLTQSDMSLLMGVASQTAISIVNASSFMKLQDSEKKYRDLVENANSIIMRIDINGYIVFFNEYAQRFFGYSDEEVLGKTIIGTILPRTQKDTRTFEGLIKDLLRDPERPIVTETENVLRNGQRVWVSWTYKLISEDGKNSKEVLCIVNNITELKRAQEERHELEARLQRSQKMEALGTLAGGVAHDLNNILSGLVGYPELLLMDLPEGSRLRKPILTIQKSGEKAAQIVQDLLTLARRGVAVTEVVNLNQIITDYLQSPEFMRLIENHSTAKLTTELDPDLMNVIGSPVHLSKTIMNLVSNAAEAMPGGGNITVRTENQYVERLINGYDSIERGDYVVLTVSDTGIGISPTDRERIFEPFYSKKVMGRSGTGLGMAVVWGTVKDHKGHIDLQSEEGKGTNFTLYFPVTRQEMANRTGPVPVEALKGEGQSILVVDDVKDQREIATEMLEKLSYKVVAVKSGEDAVKYLRDHSMDLLVLDMIMDPGIDGLETYRRVLEIHPGQRAIITSGFSESERVMEARRLGVGDYVKKPYLIEKLGLAVKQELKK